MGSKISLRWVALGVFVLASVLNYLDRQILTTLAPVLREEFRLSNTDYGLVLSAFSIAYAAAAPLAGLCIDRLGLNRGISLSVAFWSLAGIATGWARGLTGLVFSRTALGVGQAAGVPASGKAIHLYLRPEERAIGNAVSQAGLMLGAILAPPVATWLALSYGWRWAFLATGLAGFLWIPLWNWTASRIPATATNPVKHSVSAGTLLRDRQLWGFVIANVLSMTVYTLWTNWTTVYLMQERSLTLAQAAWLAWVPPLFANVGGFLGGWMSLLWMKRGTEALTARRRVCLVSAIAVLLVAGAITRMPTAGWATALIAMSMLWTSAFSVNLYTMPLDAYGVRHTAFAVSILTGAYGAMQTVASPAIGLLIDSYGFSPVCLLVSVAPLAGYGSLMLTRRG